MMSAQSLSVGGRDHLLRICRDLTLFKLIVDKHAQETAAKSVSSLANSLTIDLTNVLANLAGSLEKLKGKAGKAPELDGIIAEAENASQSARALITRLRELAGETGTKETR